MWRAFVSGVAGVASAGGERGPGAAMLCGVAGARKAWLSRGGLATQRAFATAPSAARTRPVRARRPAPRKAAMTIVRRPPASIWSVRVPSVQSFTGAPSAQTKAAASRIQELLDRGTTVCSSTPSLTSRCFRHRDQSSLISPRLAAARRPRHPAWCEAARLQRPEYAEHSFLLIQDLAVPRGHSLLSCRSARMLSDLILRGANGLQHIQWGTVWRSRSSWR